MFLKKLIIFKEKSSYCHNTLPQVASKAHKHWKIEKIIKNDEMTSQIVELNDESRVNEIASLISGAKITETAKKVAYDLLQN